MHVAPALAAVVLLEAVVCQDLPLHRRYSFDPLINDFSYLGILSKRDSCSDAFGSDARNSNCAPDQTLCCTQSNKEFPSCQQYIDKGWCCTGDGDDDFCYVDQKSACDEEGSVQCKNLKKGSGKACCPRLTTCDDALKASEDNVRCNIRREDLIEADKEGKGGSKSKSDTDKPAKTNRPKAGQPSDSPSDGLGGGAIAGIVVGAVSGVALMAGLAFWLIRRRKKGFYDASSQAPQPSISQYYEDQHMKQQQGQSGYHEPNTYYAGIPGQQGNSNPHQPSELADESAVTSQAVVNSQPSELMEERAFVELDAGSQPQPRS